MVAIRADRWRGNLAESLGVSGPKGVVYIAKPTANPALLPFFRRGEIKDWRRDVGTLGTKDLSPRNFPPARSGGGRESC